MKEVPKTAYLMRAIHEWCCDSGLTPYVAVKVDETTKVPMEYVKNGEIILNISPDATRNLKIGNELLQFSARFAGVSREISVPIAAVSGVFAKETGEGLSFQASSAQHMRPGVPARGEPATPNGDRPGGDRPGGNHPGGDRPDGDRPDPPSGGRPRLQVVK